VTGNITVKMYDKEDKLLTESQTAINATKNSGYKGDLVFSLPTSLVTSAADLSGHFDVYFSTSMFTVGPVVFPYG
jgi:hypothetical protein